MGLLSGLAHFGLGNLENMEVYEKSEKTDNMEADKSAGKVVREQDFLFDKSCSCPVCNGKFKTKVVRSGKARLTGSDQDLCPLYEQLDVLKYDVIMCPLCGYTALSRFFEFVTPLQIKNIKSTICANFKLQGETGEIYTYDEALERYQMALANAIVKRAKASERAYICLKTAWILRGRAAHLDADQPDYGALKKQCEDKENEFLRNALDGFQAARQSEGFPMCGMDQYTVDYVIAAIAARFEQYDVANRLIGGILQSAPNPRVKDRARSLRKAMEEKRRQNDAGGEG